MKNQIEEQSEDVVEETVAGSAVTESAGTDGVSVPFESGVAPMTPRTKRGRPMQKARFVWGLFLSASGMGLMLVVAAGALHGAGVNGRLSLPVVGLCMIIGLMLLGGGFGIMATASPTFDDDEFDRLMQAGDINIPAPVQAINSQSKSADTTDSTFRHQDTQRSVAEQSVA